MVRPAPRVPDPRRLRKIAVDFWFAVQRLRRPGDDPPAATAYPPVDDDPDDGDLSEAGVPRRRGPSSGTASAAVPEPTEDEPL